MRKSEQITMMKSSIECYPFRQTQKQYIMHVPNYHLNVELVLTNFENDNK